MLPVSEITVDQATYWKDFDSVELRVFGPPKGHDDTIGPVQALVTQNEGMIPIARIPWRPDKTDLLNLYSGGTVWLSLWGTVVPHSLEVSVV